MSDRCKQMSPDQRSGTALLPRKVDPLTQRVVKFLPNHPPLRGEYVLVDGIRCRVTRCKVKWDGPRWTIRKLYVKPEVS